MNSVLTKKRKKIQLAPYGFVLPATLTMLLLVVYPIVYGIYISFFNTNLVNKWKFVGLDYYLKALQERYDHLFWHYPSAPVLIINTDNIDFVHNENHLKQILDAIAECPRQTTYFVPDGN
jgi:ABC-type sugar transport system permease subunit